MSPHLRLALLALLVLFSACSSASRASAQTQDIHGSGGFDPYEDVRFLKKLAHLLQLPVDLKRLPKSAPLKDTLLALYEELAREGLELPLIVDGDLFNQQSPGGPDVWQVEVKIPSRPAKMTVAEVLTHLVDQLPDWKAVWLVRRDSFEIAPRMPEDWRDPRGVLHVEIGMEAFRRPLPLRKAITLLAVLLHEQQQGIRFFVDSAPFNERDIDVDAVQLHFPPGVASMTVAQWLQCATRCIPYDEAVFAVQPYGIELTTRRRANEVQFAPVPWFATYGGLLAKPASPKVAR